MALNNKQEHQACGKRRGVCVGVQGVSDFAIETNQAAPVRQLGQSLRTTILRACVLAGSVTIRGKLVSAVNIVQLFIFHANGLAQRSTCVAEVAD